MTTVLHTAVVPAQAAAPTAEAIASWEIVQRAQAGEPAAFADLYRRTYRTVHKYVYFRVGNRQLAEDLTQDTYVRALRRIDAFTWQGADVAAWLVTIARNLVADHFKSKRYALEVTAGDILGVDLEDLSAEGHPEQAAVDHLTNLALLTALQQVTPEQREVLVLRFLRGLSVSETARAMGRNEGAVKALQCRASRRMARVIAEGGGL